MAYNQETASMIRMIADYMENGFLENIVAMFRQDKRYYPFLGELLGDERSRVRIGTVALVESLKELEDENILLAIPGISRLLQNANATIRGDAAYLLGIIGSNGALPFLVNARDDENALVRETIEEAIEEIKEQNS